MKIIKTYENYNLDELDLGRFSKIIDKDLLTLNKDGTFDYNGNLFFKPESFKSLLEIPIRFRTVYGAFYCMGNKLTTLEGAPLYVGDSFYCAYNKLISLQYAPLKVVGDFWCEHNNLISLQYAPLEIGGDFFVMKIIYFHIHLNLKLEKTSQIPQTH